VVSLGRKENTKAMNHYDILKLKAATLYILNKCGELDFLHLFKILYFAERRQFAEYGQHLVKDTFCALERGPVPSVLYDACKLAIGRNVANASEGSRIIAASLVHGDGECEYILSAGEPADMDNLSAVNIEYLDWSISQYKDVPYRELSELSHDEAWQSAWDYRKSSPISSLLIAKAGGASDGLLDYLRAEEELDNLIAG